jgi:hypothetical protein
VALAAGDYAVANAEAWIAVVERKTLENFTTSLSDGTLPLPDAAPGRRRAGGGGGREDLEGHRWMFAQPV